MLQAAAGSSAECTQQRESIPGDVVGLWARETWGTSAASDQEGADETDRGASCGEGGKRAHLLLCSILNNHGERQKKKRATHTEESRRSRTCVITTVIDRKVQLNRVLRG